MFFSFHPGTVCSIFYFIYSISTSFQLNSFYLFVILQNEGEKEASNS